MATFAALADLASLRTRDPSHEVVTCAQWYSYLNLAFKEVQQASSQWPWDQNEDEISVTVAQGARQGCLEEAAAGGEVYEVRYVYDSTNNTGLVQATGNGARERYHTAYPSATGKPIEYRVKGNEIEVFPLPEAAVTLQIGVKKKIATDFTYDLAPPFPAAWHTILVNGALKLFHTDDGNDAAAAHFDAQFQADIANLKGAMLNGQDEKYPLLADTF